MKKRVPISGILAFACAAALLPSMSEAVAAEIQVRLAPLARSYAPPALGRKQGWLTISNRDWSSYSLVISNDDEMYLYRDGGSYGGVAIPSGATVTIALEKETYDLRGNASDKLKVRVREGRTTTLSLEPFGYVGNTGLRGIVNDGDRVRDEVLYDAYSAPVIVQPPPTVIIERPRPIPPPPPIIISRPPAHRPPPFFGHGRPGRPGRPGHRPPPPPPPRPRDRDNGLGIIFNLFGGGR